MLEVHASQLMPHALRHPSIANSDWRPRNDGYSQFIGNTGNRGKDFRSAASASTNDFDAKSSLAMSEGLAVYRDGMHGALMDRPSLGPVLPHPPVYHAVYSGSNDPPQQNDNAIASSNAQNAKTPDSQRSYNTPSESGSSKVISTLLIPDTLRVPHRDLSQLASEVACLFWFEPGTVIDMIARSNSSSNSPSLMFSPGSLSNNLTPSESFRKWLTGLLSTTQVTQNVIILALLFIYRLKKKNPGVMANPGSEFRLMTVALMLGNKFLDDNTYTNKTWADVSGISVHEIHTMEVEFLSNMRYSLFTTKEQWQAWHETLGKFGRAVSDLIKTQEAASRMALLGVMPSPKLPLSPTLPWPQSNLSISGRDPHSQTPLILPQMSSAAISPMGELPELSFSSGSRKRYRDDIVQEAPAKRRMPDFSCSTAPPILSMPPNANRPDQFKLHLPSLSIPNQSKYLPPMHGLPAPNERAMAMVYPHMQQRGPTPMAIPPLQTTGISNTSYTALDPSRQISPYPISAASSPISANPHTSHLSPSYFLGQRSSPYRPVRQVKTLLNPPRAPTSIYSAPRQVSMDHLQYHSLGQPLNERHVGHVPYFQRDAWPQSYQPRQWPSQMNLPGSYVHQQH